MRSKHPGNRPSTHQVTNTAAPQARPQRRKFLLALGAGGAVAPDAAVPSLESKGYAVTDHVRRYYRTAKI